MTCASRRAAPLALVVFSVGCMTAGVAAAAPDVYTGYEVSFAKPGYATPPPVDLLTTSVGLTRGTIQGLYNAVVESGWDGAGRSSPADTEWATGWNNPDDTITASNWAALDYTTWEQSYGGSGDLRYNITAYAAVVHLISDDIYFDLQFTYWASSGGAFSYFRSTLPPPVAPPTGDYNQNGVVDAADYTVWRDTLGQVVAAPGAGADGNQNGFVDPGDYTFWKEHYGETVSATGAIAVPEPAAVVLWLVGAMLVVVGRRAKS